MRRVVVALLGIFVAGLAPMLMGPTGISYPQNPRFQSVNVTGATSTGTLASTGASSLKNLSVNSTGNAVIAAPSSGVAWTVNGFAAANVPTSLVQGSSVAGQSNGTFIQAGNGSAADRPLDVQNYNSTQRYLGIFGDGGVVIGSAADAGSNSLNAPNLFQNGVAVPKMAYGNVTGATGGMAVHPGITSTTHPGAGIYTFVLSPFTAAPTCTATLTNAGPNRTVGVTASSATAATVGTASGSTSTDMDFSINCIGL